MGLVQKFSHTHARECLNDPRVAHPVNADEVFPFCVPGNALANRGHKIRFILALG